MNTKRKFLKYCRIKNNEIKVPESLYKEDPSLGFKEFSKAAYQKTGFKYPKFYKMDKLSKLAYLSAEFLLQGENLLEKYAAEDIALVVVCKSSSLDTDLAYQASLEEFPSPGLFVYTLPNIMIGEICIRHKFKGENACFVNENMDNKEHLEYIDSLLETKAAKICIAGTIDLLDGEYSSEFLLVE